MTGDAAIVMAGPDGLIRYWNEAAEALFGYPSAEVLGNRVDVIVPEEYRARHWQGFERVMAGGERHLEGAAINLPVRLRDGRVLAFPGRFNHLLGPWGELVGAMAVFGPRRGDEQPWSPIADRVAAAPASSRKPNGSTWSRSGTTDREPFRDGHHLDAVTSSGSRSCATWCARTR